MLLEYKVRKGELYEQKVHQAPLVFHVVAFDFEKRYDGKAFEKEFTEMVSGTTSPAAKPILNGIRPFKYNTSTTTSL